MPDLSDYAVSTWLAEREPDLVASFPPTVALPARLAGVIVRLGRALDSAQSIDPHRLGRMLRSAPLQEQMQLLLTQLDLPRRLRMLAWLGAPPMPDPQLVVESYLTGTAGSAGGSLHQELQGLYDNAVLLRIFRHERIVALLAVCRKAGRAEGIV